MGCACSRPPAEREGVQLLADHGVTYTATVFREACQAAQVALISASVNRSLQIKQGREGMNATLTYD